MPSLLDAATLAVIKSAIKDVVDTFFKVDVLIHHRSGVLDKYAESVTESEAQYHFNGLSTYSVGTDGKYITIKMGPGGQELHDSWRVFLWHDDVIAAGLTIDPESDVVTLFGKLYHFRMLSPSGQFGDLGDLLIEFEIHFDKG